MELTINSSSHTPIYSTSNYRVPSVPPVTLYRVAGVPLVTLYRVAGVSLVTLYRVAGVPYVTLYRVAGVPLVLFCSPSCSIFFSSYPQPFFPLFFSL